MTDSASRLQAVLEELDFALDDVEAANAAFARWKDGDDGAKRNVDLWTYCYIWRYFLMKRTQGQFADASDADELIAKAYQKVECNRNEIRASSRYASWVSVICKNTFLNYTRRDRSTQSIDDEQAPDLVADAPTTFADIGHVRHVFLDAVHRLPEYLQETARLYFLERRTFKEISEVIGKSVATVRTYKHKAVQRLREDDELRELLYPPRL